MLLPALPHSIGLCLGRCVSDPVAVPPPTYLHVTSPGESCGQWAGPEGVLVQFPQSYAYPSSMLMPAAPSWGSATCAHAPDQMGKVFSPVPWRGAKNAQVSVPGLG